MPPPTPMNDFLKLWTVLLVGHWLSTRSTLEGILVRRPHIGSITSARVDVDLEEWLLRGLLPDFNAQTELRIILSSALLYPRMENLWLVVWNRARNKRTKAKPNQYKNKNKNKKRNRSTSSLKNEWWKYFQKLLFFFFSMSSSTLLR